MLWEDNYFPLLPGETREVTVSWRSRDAVKAKLAVAVDGWNVPRATAALEMR